MPHLNRILTLGFLTGAAWLSASIAPGDADWPASYPDWWYNAADPANGLVDATQPVLNQNNDAILNQGQLWNMAEQGIAELDAALATLGGAGFDLSAFNNGASPSYYAAANIGQLKHVASKFYDRFAEVGFDPSTPGWPTGMTLDPSTGYPWAANQSPENLSPANIGQAKFLFSWDLTEFATIEDAAPDGLNVYVEADGTINVSWNDNSNDETSFELEVSYDQGVTWNLVEVAPGNSENIILQPGSILDPFSAKFRIRASSSTEGTTYSGSETNAKSDLDGDGTPDEEDDDTDNDGLPDTEDGWPRDPNLKFPRASESYVLIDLSSHLAYPAEEDYDERTLSIQVDDFAGVLLSYATDIDDSDPNEYISVITNKYYNWKQVLSPSDFNGNKATYFEIYDQSEPWESIINYPYLAHLSRSGIIRFYGSFGYDDLTVVYFDEDYADFATNAKAAFTESNQSFDTQNQTPGISISATTLDNLITTDLHYITSDIYYSEYAENFLMRADTDLLTSDNELYYTILDGTTIHLGKPNDEDYAGSLIYDGAGIGANGLIVYTLEDNSNNYTLALSSNQQAILKDGAIKKLGDNFKYNVISTEDTDLLLRNTNSSNEYSLDEGDSYHPAKAWNPETAALEAVSFAGKSSDELIILQNNQTGILINGQIKTASDLIGDQAEDWTDFKLHDINSHGMIVGSAVNTASGTETRSPVALLKVDIKHLRETTSGWQFNSVKLDPIPNGFSPPSGVDEKTLLTGTFEDGSVKASLVVEVPDDAAIRSKVVYNVKNDLSGSVVAQGNFNDDASSAGASEAPGYVAEIEFNGETTETESYTLQLGLDSDGDELIEVVIDETYKIVVFPHTSYASAVGIINAALFPAGNATETVLELFLGVSSDSVELPVSSTTNDYSISSSDNRLTHKLGAPFSGVAGASGVANIPQHTWTSSSEMGQILSETQTLFEFALQSVNGEAVRAALEGSSGVSDWIEFDLPPNINVWDDGGGDGLVIVSNDEDMHFAFGKVALDGRVQVKYQLSSNQEKYVPVDARIGGLIEDLTDYSYYSNTVTQVPARTAAVVQISGGNSRATRPAGSVFYNKVFFYRDNLPLLRFPEFPVEEQ